MKEDCIFCKIVKGETPSIKEYEDNEIIAFRDIEPVAPVHLLIIPKKHISKLSDITEKDCNLLGKIQLVATIMATKFGIKDGFRLLIANGQSAGQKVFHLHYHIIGGWEESSGMDKRIWSLGQ